MIDSKSKLIKWIVVLFFIFSLDLFRHLAPLLKWE